MRLRLGCKGILFLFRDSSTLNPKPYVTFCFVIGISSRKLCMFPLRIFPLLIGTNQSAGLVWFGLGLQNVSPEELALIAMLLREDVLKGLDGLQSLNYTGNMTLAEALINGERLVGSLPMSPALVSLAMKCVGSASQIVTAFDAFNDYHGPLPVPTFDAFVELGKLIRQAIGMSCFLFLSFIPFSGLLAYI